jgi:RNA ligase (TIGR02306 family)
MRKLASVVVVHGIEPIAGADAIELARIAGWQCVIKKGELRVGERAVYLEIDSVPPDHERFRWLWTKKGEAATEGARPASFRIRTLRLRGALSQGLLQTLAAAGVPADANVGDDVTALLGVTKYEPPAPSGMGDYRAPFPAVVSKTDEMRVQSFPVLLDEMRGRPFVATVKVDGTSATFLVDGDGSFHACGRNHSISEGENLYWYVARKHELPRILASHPHMVVQGEVAGPGIQKNPLALKDKQLFVFSIFDAKAARYLRDDEMRAFCATHALAPVPKAFEGDAFDETVDSLLAKAEGTYEGTKNEREGIVIRPRDGDVPSVTLGGRLSFKAISNKFLLGERD